MLLFNVNKSLNEERATVYDTKKLNKWNAICAKLIINVCDTREIDKHRTCYVDESSAKQFNIICRACYAHH